MLKNSRLEYSPAALTARMQRFGLYARKSLGQHFLWDEDVLDAIVDAFGENDNPKPPVLEIGPGLGVLTAKLAEVFPQVTAVELDATLLPALQELFADDPSVRLVQGDAMEVDLCALMPAQYDIVGNLPYQITTPLLERLLMLPGWQRMVVMVQMEAANRLRAGPGSKAYGMLSIMAGYYAHTTVAASVSPQAFVPPPHVDSQVLCLQRIPPPVIAEPAALFRTARLALAQRRKQLGNASVPDKKAWLAALAAAGVDATRRGETLSLAELSQITEGLQGNKG